MYFYIFHTKQGGNVTCAQEVIERERLKEKKENRKDQEIKKMINDNQEDRRWRLKSQLNF